MVSHIFFLVLSLAVISSEALGTEGFCKYILRKTWEVRHLDRSNFLAVALRAAIMADNVSQERIFVSLGDLVPCHLIEDKRPSSRTKMLLRAQELEENKELHLANGYISEDTGAMDSLHSMRVIKVDGKFVIFDGNGRYFALQEVFSEHQDIKIPVVYYKTQEKLVETLARSLLRARNLPYLDNLPSEGAGLQQAN